MANQKVNFIVGLVVLAALLILVFGVYFLKDSNPVEKTDLYHVIFDKVSTLAVGDPVKLNGVTMGRVKYIELWKNRVRVSFNLKHSFTNQSGDIQGIFIPKDSRVRVQNIGLMGERQIEIHLGEVQDVYTPGDIIENGYFDAGIAEAMGTAGKVFEEAEDLVMTIRDVFDSTIGQDDFVELFRGVLDDTKGLTQNLQNLLDDVDPKIRSSIVHLDNAGKELELLLNNNKAPIEELTQNAKAISERAGAVMGEVEIITREVQNLIQQVNSNDGALGAMINDTAFYGDLKATLGNADSLLSIIRKQGLDVNIDFF
ncbi:MAG: MCE family protein [Fibrobacteria bacterium]|nr:MCE family protein [Fibrobacteria bacterium]